MRAVGALLAWSTRRPRLVLAAAVLLAIAGVAARRGLVRDAIPDLSDPQVVLIADWMGHAAVEVESRVTAPLTRALAGMPGTTAVRGTSMPGMAYVDVVFDSAAAVHAGRREIDRRLAALRPALPPTARLQLGPAASSTGWVWQYALVDTIRHTSAVELRRLQEDVLGPALASIPGVAEVAPLGGSIRQVSVEASPDLLRDRGLAFTDVLAALRAAVGGPESPGRAPAAAITIEEIQALPVGPPGDDGTVSVRLKDVAYARLSHDMPSGLADLGGAFRAVGGVVIAERGADVPSVIAEVRRRIEQQRARLPAGVQLVKVYDRGDLIARVDHTLLRALGEEVGVVVLVILIFLLHGRSALVPLVTLPLILLATFAAMWLLRLPASLMSLGGMGIALGIAVDADVVALEACHRRLEGLESLGPGASPEARQRQVLAAAAGIVPAILTSLLIAALSFLPVFAFTDEAGRLLRPLALTKTLVIGAAVLVTVTVAASLRARLLSRGEPVRPEMANPLTRALVRAYRPFVSFALDRPLLTLATAALAVASCLPLLPRLGREFLPRIDEGDLLYMPTTLPSVPPAAAQNQLHGQDRALAAFKEVATVFGKVGRADTATDPAPYSMAETTIRLRPRDEWPDQTRARWYSGWAPRPLRWVLGWFWPERAPSTLGELTDRMDQAVRLPGWVGAWTAPARARMDMMATGVRTAVALRVVAATPERLDALAVAAREALARAPGVRSAGTESLGGETRLTFAADAAAMARHGVDPALVQETADLVVNGGQIAEQRRDGHLMRFRLLPASMDSMRGMPDQLRDVTVRARARTKDGAQIGTQPVPLGLLGRPVYTTRPATLRTERGELCAYVTVDLPDGTGNDLTSAIAGGQRELDRAQAAHDIVLGAGERFEWAGQYPLLAAGERRLRWIVPTVVLAMLLLLYGLFRNASEALIVLASVPFALVGSVWALYVFGYPLSAPVWVGLLSVLGLAMQTGVVMVVYIDEAFHRHLRQGRIHTRADIVEAHAEGTVRRLRPKLMTVTTMAAGLLPFVWTDGAGSEILRRVAAPMLGGLATSAFLTLEVLPVLYTIWRHRQLVRARRRGVPLETIVGPPPSWA